MWAVEEYSKTFSLTSRFPQKSNIEIGVRCNYIIQTRDLIQIQFNLRAYVGRKYKQLPYTSALKNMP